MKSITLLRLNKAQKGLRDSDADKVIAASGDKVQDKLATELLAKEISALQSLLYAEQGRKLLVVLQGMDTAGKDRSIGSTFSQCNLMGVRAASFKAPTAAELAHDFLWRVHAQVPAKGQIVVFNRSHYEDVLVPRVHGWIDEHECEQRYRHIIAFENMLHETGTTILKIFIHISRQEQTNRLRARLQDPQKQWKFDASDLHERPYWDAYQQAYWQAMSVTDADSAPWYIVPGNSKTQRNLQIAMLVKETLENMQLAFPPFRPDLAQLVVD
ncbi:MAG: polyphosphate kinase 2 family protein [Burkholderiales bacterium]|nr:polyphosphate kinase 2 family protein [Burkholderiales bacterium]